MFVFGFFFIASGFKRHFEDDWKRNKGGVPPAEEGGPFHNLWSRLFGDHGDKAALKETSDLASFSGGDAPPCTIIVEKESCEDFHNTVQAMFPKVNTAYEFRDVRTYVRKHGGLKCIGTYLSAEGLVIGDKWQHEGQKNFIYNVHAQIGAKLLKTSWSDNKKMTKEQQKQMYEDDQEALGKYNDEFVLARNLWEKDDDWNNEKPDKNALPSMGKRHRFLDITNQHWKWFNVVAFGLDPKDLPDGIRILKEAKEAAEKYRIAMGWGDSLLIVVHCFGHNSVQSLHIHIIDNTNPQQELGESYYMQEHKNLPIDDVIKVLQDELAEYNADEKANA